MKKPAKKEQFKIGYNIRVRTWNEDKTKILKETIVHNTIVDNGLNLVRDLLGNATDTNPSHIAIGTDNTSETTSDTALGTEVARESATIDTATNFQVEYDKTFTFGSGESYTIVEAGLFNDPSAGTMLNRGTFAGHTVDSANPLQVTITITISRP